MPSLGTASINNFILRQSGFEIGNLHWTSASNQFGSVLSLKGVDFQTNNFKVNYGDTTTVSGTIQLTVTEVKLFPTASFVTSQITGTQLSYDFQQGTGSLKISMSHLMFKVGDALKMDADNIVLTPGADIVAIVPSLQVTSGVFENFGSAVVQNFTIRKDGFNLGSLVISQQTGTTAKLGSVLSVEGAVLAVTDFNLTVGTQTTISGSVALTASSVSLFPGMRSVSSTLEGVMIDFSFGNGGIGKMLVHTNKLTLSIGSVLRLEASNLTIEPSNQTAIVTIGTATVSAPQLQNIAPVTIQNFVIRQDGFSLASLELSQVPGKPVVMGNYLQMDGVKLKANNLNVSSSGVQGTINLEIANLELFPQSTIINTVTSGLTASFDFSDPLGQLKIAANQFRMDIGEALSFQTSGVTITPGQTEIMRVASINVSSPSMQGLSPIQMTNFVVRNNGFSIGNLELRLPQGSDTVNFGSVLRVTNPVIKVQNFNFVYGSQTTLSGAITLETSKVELFPGMSFLKSSLTNITGAFDLNGGTASLSLTVGSLSIQVGQALAFSASNVSLTPGKDEIARIKSVQVSSASLTGLAPITLNELVIHKNGFELGAFTLSQQAGTQIKMGNAITVTGRPYR